MTLRQFTISTYKRSSIDISDPEVFSFENGFNVDNLLRNNMSTRFCRKIGRALMLHKTMETLYKEYLEDEREKDVITNLLRRDLYSIYKHSVSMVCSKKILDHIRYIFDPNNKQTIQWPCHSYYSDVDLLLKTFVYPE